MGVDNMLCIFYCERHGRHHWRLSPLHAFVEVHLMPELFQACFSSIHIVAINRPAPNDMYLSQLPLNIMDGLDLPSPPLFV